MGRWALYFFFFITLSCPFPAYPTTPPHQATPPPSLPSPDTPLGQQSSPIPEKSDGPFQVWNEKDKYFLVIAVDETALKGKDINLARTNGPKVADTFVKLEYKPLLEDNPVLTGDHSNRTNLISALNVLKNLGSSASVIMYYSGHGITTDRDSTLWLQLSGQDWVGPGKGISLSEVVTIPRMGGYLGELFVILDASYSGNASVFEAIALQNLNEKTLIFSSSGTRQNSQPLRLPEGKRSAFTTLLLKALNSQWLTADENRDGILRIVELHNFTRIGLQRHFRNKEISESMTPELIGARGEELFIAYRRDQVQQWDTEDRTVLQILALERALSPSISRGETLAQTSSGKLEISKHAEFLAQPLSSRTNDLYTKGLISLAQGSLKEARELFDTAAEQEGAHSPKLAKIYLARGRTELYAGRFKLAIVWYKKSLALQPPVDAKLLNEFGLVWVKAGVYEEALPFLEQGLKLREKTFDPQDPNMAVSLNNLAALYDNLGKYSEAEPLYRRALQSTENALGPEHSSLVIPLNNLAKLCLDQGRYAEAEPLYQRALQITEQTLGPDHPEVATALNNLGLVFKAQGKYAEAEPLYRRVVQIDEANLGPTHPKVAYDLNTLALMYRAQGKHAESEPLYQRLVEIDETALGPDHPEVATDLNNLAELYRAQGKYAEAEPLYQRSYAIYRRQLGLRHHNTRTVLNNYLLMLNKSGRADEARRIKEEYHQAIRAQNPP